MAKNYNNKASEKRNDVSKLFDDLEALRDFCRIELLPFNEADLYNRNSKVWQKFEASRRGRKPFERKPRSNINTRNPR